MRWRHATSLMMVRVAAGGGPLPPATVAAAVAPSTAADTRATVRSLRRLLTGVLMAFRPSARRPAALVRAGIVQARRDPSAAHRRHVLGGASDPGGGESEAPPRQSVRGVPTRPGRSLDRGARPGQHGERNRDGFLTARARERAPSRT
jgi:hypothetical protein